MIPASKQSGGNPSPSADSLAIDDCRSKAPWPKSDDRFHKQFDWRDWAAEPAIPHPTPKVCSFGTATSSLALRGGLELDLAVPNEGWAAIASSERISVLVNTQNARRKLASRQRQRRSISIKSKAHRYPGSSRATMDRNTNCGSTIAGSSPQALTRRGSHDNGKCSHSLIRHSVLGSVRAVRC